MTHSLRHRAASTTSWALRLLVLLAFVSPACAQWFKPQGPAEPPSRPAERKPTAPSESKPSDEVVTIKVTDGSLLKVRVLRPAGAGPFPLALVSHGSPASAAQRPTMPVPLLRPISDWLLAKGYLVALPLRRGYGESGGGWAEGYGSCKDPDYRQAGLRGAADILDVAAALRSTKAVRPDRLLLVGWSAGGWASLAAASTHPDGLVAAVNFAGGRGGGQPGGNCLPGRLVEASARYGATTRVPTLWLYALNDQFFEPALARQMFDAFVKAGGRGTFGTLPPFRSDGHQLFADERGRPLWEPQADAFLREAEAQGARTSR